MGQLQGTKKRVFLDGKGQNSLSNHKQVMIGQHKSIEAYLILVTTATTGGGGKFFQVRGIFLTVNAKSSHKR